MEQIFPSLDIKTLNMKYSRICINSNIGEEIKKSMSEAEKFIYIISPYIHYENINFLKSLNKNIDIKMIFSDKTNFFSSSKELENLLPFFLYSSKQDIDIEKERYEKEKNEKISKISFYRFFYSITFLISILILGFLYYFKKLNNINTPILTLLLIVSLYKILSYKDEVKKNHKKFK